MNGDRQPLEVPSLDGEFAPRPKSGEASADKSRVDKVSQFPSREAVFVQLNVRTTADVSTRFRNMSDKDRRTHGEMLVRLMDFFEENGGKLAG